MTLHRLLLTHLYTGYTRTWTDRRKKSLNAAFDGSARRPTESDITELLAAATGDLESLLVDFFWKAANVAGTPPAGTRIRTYASDFAHYYPPANCCPHEPDLILTTPASDPSDPPVPRVVVEVKGNAHINGRHGYCTHLPGRYNNQVLAYPTGCWTNAPLDDTAFVWLTLDKALRHPLGPWGRGGIIDADYVNGNLQPYQQAQETWNAAGWGDLLTALAVSEEGRITAKIIHHWLQGKP